MNAEEEAYWVAEAAKLRAEVEECRLRREAQCCFFTVEKAERYTGRTRSEILSAVERGELKAVTLLGRPDDRWRFFRSALDRWMGAETKPSETATQG